MINLTEKQRLIVETTKSKVVVVASAAAGKTRCITERVRWLLGQGVTPEKIAAITFTNAAAEEISERLGNPEGVYIGTIHGLANYFLRLGGVDTSQILNEEKFDVAIDGFFLAIGHKPNTDLFAEFLELDTEGYIKVEGHSPCTNILGVYAAGDCADPYYRQAIVAAASGCKAAMEAEKYLASLG